MIIKTKVVKDILYIHFDGEFDQNCAVFVRDELEDALTDNIYGKVVLDMSRMTFMDSSGIGILLGRYKKLLARKIPMYIVNPNPTIDRLITLSGLYMAIPKISSKEKII